MMQQSTRAARKADNTIEHDTHRAASRPNETNFYIQLPDEVQITSQLLVCSISNFCKFIHSLWFWYIVTFHVLTYNYWDLCKVEDANDNFPIKQASGARVINWANVIDVIQNRLAFYCTSSRKIKIFFRNWFREHSFSIKVSSWSDDNHLSLISLRWICFQFFYFFSCDECNHKSREITHKPLI